MGKVNQKISIIMPVYNVEIYLEQSIKSVLKQSYKNWELIIVDDGSTDNSLKICKLYAERDSRIHVYHKRNCGLGAARNTGLSYAHGEFIAFLDSDDWLEEDFCLVMLEKLQAAQADICVCGYFSVLENEKIIKSDCFIKEKILDKEDALLELIINKKISSHVWNKLYKKELFFNQKFPEDKNYEDVYIMHEIFLKAVKIVGINHWLIYYRRRKDSISGSQTLRNEIHAFEAFYNRYRIFENHYAALKKYLLKAPIEIGLRIYLVILPKIGGGLKSHTLNEEDELKEPLALIYDFLKKVWKWPVSYLQLSMKYRLSLFAFGLLKRRER